MPRPEHRISPDEPRTIPLANGRGEAIVDAADYERISARKWQRHGRGYAYRTVDQRGVRQTVLMHRMVLNAPIGMTVDHIDGNPLNNSASNLRLCSHAENCRNKRAAAIGPNNRHSRFKGVSRRKGRWVADIRVDGASRCLGGFDTETDAAIAYDNAARQAFAQFARLNFPSANERGA